MLYTHRCCDEVLKVQETNKGIILDVHVKPNSKQFKLELEGDCVVVLCREAPVKGKVNVELLKVFSRLFDKRVELVSGFSSRNKRFLILDIEAEEIETILVSALKLR